MTIVKTLTKWCDATKVNETIDKNYYWQED